MPAQVVVPRHGVAKRVRLGVAHVQVARRIREHVQDVRPRPRVRRVVAGPEHVQLGPPLLPLLLDRTRIEAIRVIGGCHDFLACMVRSGSAPAWLWFRRPSLGQQSLGKRKRPRITRGSRANDRMVGAAR